MGRENLGSSNQTIGGGTFLLWRLSSECKPEKKERGRSGGTFQSWKTENKHIRVGLVGGGWSRIKLRIFWCFGGQTRENMTRKPKGSDGDER